MRAATAIVVLLCSPSAATLRDPRPAVLAAPFACTLALSVDPALEDRWNYTPSSAFEPVTTETVFRKQDFAIYPFFSGHSSDKGGSVRIQYGVSIARPDGKPYHESKDVQGWEGAPTSGSTKLLAAQIVHVCFEPEDPLGKYAVTVTARDTVSGKAARAKGSVRLVEYTEGELEADDVGRWFGEYHTAPRPELAIPGLRAIVAGGNWDEVKGQSVTGFFREIFETNPWLFPILLTGYAGEEDGVQGAVLWLLAHCSYDAGEFVRALDEGDQALLRGKSKENRRDPLRNPIGSAGDLDELWGMFFASGKLAPIRRLCDALAPEETQGKMPVTTRAVLETASAWSIRSNVRQHPLVKSYCECILRSDGVGEKVRKALRKALEG